jgi:hypothetical protein
LLNIDADGFGKTEECRSLLDHQMATANAAVSHAKQVVIWRSIMITIPVNFAAGCVLDAIVA